MSRAFIKEDVEVAERPMLRRSSSGLPPGTLNLMTADGAEYLRERMLELKRVHPKDPDIPHLEAVLQSATIVQPIDTLHSIVFGSAVHLQSDSGQQAVYRIVGVDEVDLSPHYVSWVSYLGRTLLGAGGLGARISLSPSQRSVWTVKSIE
ncbi:MAG: greA [Prosthecobacter sp.]|nr:greA [Prosthecobacter sp.]